MFKKLFLPLILVAAVVAAVGYFYKNSGKIGLLDMRKTIKIGQTVIRAEVADTPEKRTQGLSGKSGLEENSGMLFVFDRKDIAPVFWMKDMLFPIDIIWIDDGVIADIHKNIPPPKPGTSEDDLTNYSAKTPIDYVLEVKAGFADEKGLKTGDSVVFDN